MHLQRTAITARTLNARIARLVSSFDACSQCIVGCVETRIPDADGCNWNLSKILGTNCLECLDAVRDSIASLRKRFMLGDVDGVESTAHPLDL